MFFSNTTSLQSLHFLWMRVRKGIWSSASTKSALVFTFYWAFLGLSCTYAVSQSAGAGVWRAQLSPSLALSSQDFLLNLPLVHHLPQLGAHSQTCRAVRFSHLLPAKFSVTVNTAGFHPLLKIDLPPLAANLIFFLVNPLLIKLQTELGKRQTDNNATDPCCSCLKL